MEKNYLSIEILIDPIWYMFTPMFLGGYSFGFKEGLLKK